MAYLIFDDIKIAEEHQAKLDAELGFPEKLEDLRVINPGPYTPAEIEALKELGRAHHYAPIIEHPDGKQWALELPNAEKPEEHLVPVLRQAAVDAKAKGEAVVKPVLPEAPKEATAVAELPEGWVAKVEVAKEQ